MARTDMAERTGDHTHTYFYTHKPHQSCAETLTDVKICVGDGAYPVLTEPQLKSNTLGMLMNFYFTLH